MFTEKLFWIAIFFLSRFSLNYADSTGTHKDWTAEAIDRHNVFRKGYDAPPLVTNDYLCLLSQFWASQLADGVIMDQVLPEDFSYGVNVYVSTFGSKEVYGSTPVDFWYDRINYFDFETFTSYTDDGSDSFTQVVWKSTKEACVSHATSKKFNKRSKLTTYVVALYNPPGNIEGAYSKNILPLRNTSFFYKGSWAAPKPVHLTRAVGITYRGMRRKRAVEWIRAGYYLDKKSRLQDQPNDYFRDGEKPRSHKLCRAIKDFQYTVPGTPPEWTILALARMNHYRYKHGAHMLVLHREICLLAQFLTDGMASTDGVLALPNWKNCGVNYYVHHGDGRTTLNPNAAADAWGKESVNYNYANVSVNELRVKVNGKPTPGNENFTQMVWEDSFESCITMSETPDKKTTYVIALFYPKGNVEEQYFENVRKDRTWIELHDAADIQDGSPPFQLDRNLKLQIIVWTGTLLQIMNYNFDI